jgi:hypothetical protein
MSTDVMGRRYPEAVRTSKLPALEPYSPSVRLATCIFHVSFDVLATVPEKGETPPASELEDGVLPMVELPSSSVPGSGLLPRDGAPGVPAPSPWAPASPAAMSCLRPDADRDRFTCSVKVEVVASASDALEGVQRHIRSSLYLALCHTHARFKTCCAKLGRMGWLKHGCKFSRSPSLLLSIPFCLSFSHRRLYILRQWWVFRESECALLCASRVSTKLWVEGVEGGDRQHRDARNNGNFALHVVYTAGSLFPTPPRVRRCARMLSLGRFCHTPLPSAEI